MDTTPKVYHELPLTQYNKGILFNDNEGEIIDWLSQFDYPRELLSSDSMYSLLSFKDSVLDIYIVNTFKKKGDEGITVLKLEDVLRNNQDLRFLGRPYENNELAYFQLYIQITDNLQMICEEYGLEPLIIRKKGNEGVFVVQR